MTESKFERGLILYFRLAMGWTFLYAACHQLADPAWSVVGFLGNTKTFHDILVIFAAPALAPYTTFLVEYGHLLIGLSLIFGLLTRISASFGFLLMIVYWMAHMDFPYVETKLNFLLDYHLVYAGVLSYLILKHAGHVFGLDGLLRRQAFFSNHPGLKPLVA